MIGTKKIAIVFQLICLLGLSLKAQEIAIPQTKKLKPIKKLHSNKTAHTISSGFIDSIYLEYDPEHFIDNYFPFAHHQLETGGSFATPDPYTFAFQGASFKWNQYYMNGHRFNDAFMPGKALHKPNLVGTKLFMDPSDLAMSFFKEKGLSPRYRLKYSHGPLGGRVADADAIVKNLSGHSSSYDRRLVDFDWRRGTRGVFELYNSNVMEWDGKEWEYELLAQFGDREITTFNELGLNGSVREDFNRLYMAGQMPSRGRFLDEIRYMFTAARRSRAFSEYYYNENETADHKEINASFFGKNIYEGDNSILLTGINISYQELIHRELNFSRNLFDVDGEGFEPWYPDAGIFQLSHHFVRMKDINRKIHVSVEGYNSWLQHNSKSERFYNTTYVKDDLGNYNALYYIDWESQSFATALLENTANVDFRQYLKGKHLLKVSVGLGADAFVVGDESMVAFTPQFDIRLTTNKSKFNYGLRLGHKRIPFHFDQVRFLSDDYLSGNKYYWNDFNGDQLFDEGEQGDLFTTTGGSSHSLSDELKQPTMWYVDISISYQIRENSEITLTGQYRSFRNQWRAAYDKSPEEYGYYNDEGLFFLNDGEVNYEVVPFDSDRMNAATETSGFLFDNPFYAGATLQYERQGKKLFLGLSFTAYMVVGYGALGNGVLHNNVDVLSESQANPNTYIKYLGRLDTDRSYIGNIFLSYRANESWTVLLSAKYKDGQPFNTYDIALDGRGENQQAAIWSKGIPGDNPFTGEFNKREDAFWNVEVRARYYTQLNQHPLQLELGIYNIFDLGLEIAEYGFGQGTLDGRPALDVQTPRGIQFALAYFL